MQIEIRTGMYETAEVKAKEIIIPTPKGYRFAVHKCVGENGYALTELSTGYSIAKGFEEDEAIVNGRLIVLEKIDILDEKIADAIRLSGGIELNQINDFFN